MQRLGVTAFAGMVLLASACGSDPDSSAAVLEDPAPLAKEDEAMYDAVVAILDDRDLPLCQSEVDGFRPAPSGQAAAASAHFRYLDGRIHELGSCDLALDRRGELRVYRYPDRASRDDAARSSSERNARPNVMWTYGEAFLMEQWIFATPETNPGFAQFADTVHNTLSRLPEAVHVETAPPS